MGVGAPLLIIDSTASIGTKRWLYRLFKSLKRWNLSKKLIIFVILLLNYVLIYFCTNIVLDWDDPINWVSRQRAFHTNELSRPHHTRSRLLNCGALVAGDPEELENYRTQGRYSVEEIPSGLSMRCEDIRKRVIYNGKQEEVKHSYAISRVVYRDYYWLEALLSQTYSPFNHYCYAVDSKSPAKLFKFLKRLQGCFENVIVVDKRLSFDSSGHNINFGHMECTKELIKRKGWKYLLWLQNHDILLRTNREMSDVIEFLNGSQSIGHKPAQWKRYNVFDEWTATSLKLWKNDARLIVSQNYNEVMVSRQLVQFLLDEMNIANLLNTFEQPWRFATDELLWATLIASTDLELPGQPRNGCPDNRYYIFRYNEWLKPYSGSITECRSSGFARHGTCIFGMEYLKQFSQLHQVTANKVLPSFDYGAIVCFGELLHNRTYLGYESPPSMKRIYTGSSKDFC